MNSYSFLVVDDNPRIRKSICTYLQDRLKGVTIEEAGNGKQALEKAETGHYDLILMDLMMPLMDGFEATRRLVSSSNPCPIFWVTMSTDDTVRAAFQTSGARALISKERLFEDLLPAMQKLLPDLGLTLN